MVGRPSSETLIKVRRHINLDGWSKLEGAAKEQAGKWGLYISMWRYYGAHILVEILWSPYLCGDIMEPISLWRYYGAHIFVEIYFLEKLHFYWKQSSREKKLNMEEGNGRPYAATKAR